MAEKPNGTGFKPRVAHPRASHNSAASPMPPKSASIFINPLNKGKSIAATPPKNSPNSITLLNKLKGASNTSPKNSPPVPHSPVLKRKFDPATPPKSCSPMDRNPFTKAKSAGPERFKAAVPLERFLSVDQAPNPVRRSGSGLQDLSGNTSPLIVHDAHKIKGKGLLNNLLLPINTYVRRRSQSRERRSSSDLGDSDDSPTRAGIGGSNKNIGPDIDMKRRGSYGAFFSIISSHVKDSNSRRNSIDVVKILGTKSKPSTAGSGKAKRKNSLEVLRDRKEADIKKELKTRKPESTRIGAEKSSGVSNHKDSLYMGKGRKRDSLENMHKRKTEKTGKKKSLGETLNLKIPMSSIRRNSMDAFNLKSLFSLSRKNSAEDVRDKEKDPLTEGGLKLPGFDPSKRRHSHGGGEISGGTAYVYKPLQRPRLRLGSHGFQNSRSDEKSNTAGISGTGIPAIVLPVNSRATSRRGTSPAVIVSPPSGGGGGSSNEMSNSTSESGSSSYDSWSHSSITSLESGDCHPSDSSDCEDKSSKARTLHNRRKKVAARLKTREPSNSSRNSSGTEDDVFHTSSSSMDDEEEEEKSTGGGDFWASLQATPPPLKVEASSEEEIFNLYDDVIFPGRRNSGELHERSRNSSGSLTSVYIRGADPAKAATVFRDSRGLPSADAFMATVSGVDESLILVEFFKQFRCYDLIPNSAKLVIFDTSLQVKKAFYALVNNMVRAAPLWDHAKQKFVGMLTITDFIRILHSFHHSQDPQMQELEQHRLHQWRTILHDDDRPLISICPNESLYAAIRLLIHYRIHRLPVIDPSTGNVLYIITHKRILKFLNVYMGQIPQPSILQRTLAELKLGTFANIETATPDTLIIEALDKFVKRRISALPIVDEDGKLKNIYAKFDVINLAAEGTYHNLDVTLQKANECRNEWFEGVYHCRTDETLSVVMDRIIRAEVHRLVVVDSETRVVGIVSLSDILKELVLKPCGDEHPQKEGVDNASYDAEETLSPSSSSPQPPLSSSSPPLTKSGSDESCGADQEGLSSPQGDVQDTPERGNASPVEGSGEGTPDAGKASPVEGKASSGDSEDEGRYSMDKSEETPPVATPEVIPISG